MTKGNLVIDAQHLHKSFNDLIAVKDISLQVNRGDIFGFLGPNGSGKTTTIRMLCGLLTPDYGSGTCLGYDIITQTDSIKRQVGYVPQHFSLYKQLTVYENIMLMAELYGITDRESRLYMLLDKLNLMSRKDQVAGTLSGGLKQRLSLACGLIHEPYLLLLDEPTASVDPSSRKEFWRVMHDLSDEGMTILLSSHNMDEVEHCDQIAYIADGELIMNGSIKDIINTVNLTTWQVKGNYLKLIAKQLEATPDIEQVISFHDSLHVSSRNKELLMEAIKPYQNKPDIHWTEIISTLDDVFVWLSHNKLEGELK
ncbi:ABC transporter ATP-binding protein [Legionella waltersii]|uniref:ABC transporter ATP-binding protein n=1 Tax=Legionella waltersii TaxID=66969 RepID=A0A0W1AP63_9GAMM|nr:ABC transporter ATP-binding protein [Legionella waltersii]KTD83101.1 ABC transporter ATP-binding protein [Legionella waltersii]SNU96672.1 ABC transporter ATP-binding protein [Legionella waltersii]